MFEHLHAKKRLENFLSIPIKISECRELYTLTSSEFSGDINGMPQFPSFLGGNG